MLRKRLIYLLYFILTIPLGLATRSAGNTLPPVIKIYGGDTLYATCAFFLFCFIFRKLQLFTVALFALLFCFGIELLQLYKAEWIEKIRNTGAFGLILGHGFLWSDLLCYTAGVAIGLLIGIITEKLLKQYKKK